MMKFKPKILVPYDGSKHADKAIDTAISLAEQFKGTITVLHVPWKESDIESHRLLMNAVDKLQNTYLDFNTRSERSEQISTKITQIQKEEGYDIIVMGSRGHGVGKAWILGSVSRQVLEEASCPVLVVK